MDGTLIAIVLMLITWWIMFRMARWLGGWDGRHEEEE